MNDDTFLQSRFWHWHSGHASHDYEAERALRREALALIVEAVNAGEIVTLDGADSPLSRQIKAHHGRTAFEMNSHWISTSQNWSCPCCGRSKLQVSRVGRKGQILAKLVIHHDHMGEALEAAWNSSFAQAGTQVAQSEGRRLVERIGAAFAAYEEVLICEDCNNADTEAKKIVSSPKFFSFSIGQIQRFILSRSNQPHTVDATSAHAVWQEAEAAYQLRMKLIWAVARAAATDSHWYEPYQRGVDAIPTLGTRRGCAGDTAILEWASSDELCNALGRTQGTGKRNLSRWRTSRPARGAAPPSNFAAILQSSTGSAASWESVDEDWRCPICARPKVETVYVHKNHSINFCVHRNPGRGSWTKAAVICNHCQSTLMSLKLELSELIGFTPRDSFAFVTPKELASIIVARPNSAHEVRQESAAALVKKLAERLTGTQLA